MVLDLYLLQADLRRRWRSLLALATLVAVVVAAVLTALAGARHTMQAFDEYLAQVRPMDAILSTFDPGSGAPASTDVDLERIPGIEAAVGMHWYAAFPGDLNQEFIPLVVPDDDRIPGTYARHPVVEGRRPDPDAPLEVALGERTARRLGVGLGDELPVDAFTEEEMAAGFSPGNPAAANQLALEVVGILRGPGDIASRENDIELTFLTPAFRTEYGDEIALFALGQFIRLEPGADLSAVAAEIADRYGEGMELETFVGSDVVRAQAEPTLQSMATGLQLIALVVALVGGTSIVLSVARGAADRATDHDALRALGLDRPERLRHLGLAPAASGLLGVAVGAMASTFLLPFSVWGLAERADPPPWPEIDPLVLLVGGLAAAVLVLVAVLAVGLVTLRRQRVGRTGVSRPSAVASRAAGAGARLTTVAGLRLAFERGRGGRAIPIASAAIATTLGGLGVVAALIFSSSLQHTVSSPGAWGYAFDAILNRNVDGEGHERATDPVIAEALEDPDLAEVAEYVLSFDVTVDGTPEEAVVLDDLSGHTPFVVAAGREPVGAGEVAAGGTFLADHGLSVGDRLTVDRGDRSLDLAIVGVAVLPVSDDGGLSSTGLAIRRETADALGFDGTCSDEEPCTRGLAVSVRPGVDPADAVARHAEAGDMTYVPPSAPSEVERLTVVDRLPRLLAGFLALISVVTVTHAASTTVRRRRRDLAIMRVLGFTGRDLRAIVRVQVATIALLGAAAGVVLGVAVGRLLWSGVARSIYLPTLTELPAAALVIVPVVTVAVALLAATASRRAAGRIPAGLALRAE